MCGILTAKKIIYLAEGSGRYGRNWNDFKGHTRTDQKYFFIGVTVEGSHKPGKDNGRNRPRMI